MCIFMLFPFVMDCITLNIYSSHLEFSAFVGPNGEVEDAIRCKADANCDR